MSARSSHARRLLICFLLIAATLAVFGQVVSFDFVLLDDPDYVANNPYVQGGISARGLLWSFTTTQAANWHPLTWLSHMLDWQVYGSQPWGHHLTNLLLHALNTLLVFGVLARGSRRSAPSALVAALFALHPLHVESVAWVAERKDLLSTAFGLLSIWAYVTYARDGKRAAYAWAFVLYGLGLMSKPMLVTYPLLFLLLDYWPLRRMTASSFGRVLSEKLPFLALSAASSAITFVVQRHGGAVASDLVPFPLRVANALVAYARYVLRTVWPSNLAVLYPHPYMSGGTPWTGLQVAAAAAFVLGATAIVIRMRRHRYLLVGWSWFLVGLLPVIGIVQVGQQAMADRYTYVPLVGLFIVLAWGVADLASCAPTHRRIVHRGVLASAVSLVVACGVGSWAQARHWRDSVTLFRHGLEVAPTALIHDNLGTALSVRGELDAAITQYRAALRIHPGYGKAHNNLANALLMVGRLDDAIVHYREGLAIDPNAAAAHHNLATALREKGALAEALRHFRRALEIAPSSAGTWVGLADTLRAEGSLQKAIECYREALRIRPDDAGTHAKLGELLRQSSLLEEAILHFRRALELQPHDPAVDQLLRETLEEKGPPLARP